MNYTEYVNAEQELKGQLAWLVFIALWAVAMAYWQFRRVRATVAGTQPAA